MDVEQFELEIGEFTYLVTKANYKEDTWNVMCSLIDYTFYLPAQEKWSPMITITCEAADEVEAKLVETLSFIETKLDPFLSTRPS